MCGGGSRTEDAIAASDPHAVDPHAAAEPGLAARIRTVLSESAIYGVILVSALIIVTGQKSDTSWDTFLKVLGTVVVFWIAHVFAGVVSNLGMTIDGDKSFGALLLYAVRHSSGLLLGALIPLLIILLGAAGVIADDTAVWVALWIDAALLGIIGYLAVARMTTKPWARSLGALVTALLGVAIMVMKALIH
ncbi:MAG TPA: hypothetical protein PLY47_12635 [Rhodoglobus sp.]|jgi:hypothetical protein|nr:hypothetical protein [Rhodoglobus sp.]